MPIVSVVIPTYNAAKYLTETINSVLEQDFDDLEIIVVDDKSTDNTQEVLNEIGSDKIRYYRLEENHGGPSLPRSVGVKEAKGEFIALCDSDDLFAPGRLSSAVKFLRDYPELGMVFTDEQKFDGATGKDLGNFLEGYELFHSLPKKEVAENHFVIASKDAFWCLFYENYIMPSGVTVCSSVFRDVGCFDETITNADDWDMWFKIAKKFPIGFIDEVGFMYRIRRNSISRRGVQLAKNRVKVLKKQIKGDLPPEISQRIKLQLAIHYRGIGYHYQKVGQVNDSRKYYLKSLSESLSWGALKGVLVSMSGNILPLGRR